MPLLFSNVCDLLSTLEELSTCEPLPLPRTGYQKQKDVVLRWLSVHRITVQEPAILIVALLSALLPAKRTDRVYNTQRPRLVSSLKRWLSLGAERQRMLEHWKIPGRGDLGECVERVMQQTDDRQTLTKCKVSLEEVHIALEDLASKSRFSGPKVKERENHDGVHPPLASIYRRLHSVEAKWLTRMILKDFSQINIEASILYRVFDERFPALMEVYNDFEPAVTALKSLPSSHALNGHCAIWTQPRAGDQCFLSPKVGVKVGSPKWVKAKGGVRHALSIIDGRVMSVERKHDGEYCQIHIDLSKGHDCIQLFSKSGKDSTIDRINVHHAIKEGLRIGKVGCKFSKTCILVGELLVWSNKTAEMLDFYKIRKHVSRSGSHLGTEKDSQPHPWENLMIVYFDVLLIDDEPVIHQIYKQRRQRLEMLIERIKGKADIVWRTIVNFSESNGSQVLKTNLARAFVQRWEGLVLKPLNEPYFDCAGRKQGRYPACWIKLKKDCITGLGDTADLAIVGAGYDPKVAVRLKIPHLSWTHFFLACLVNKQDVQGSHATPSFFVLGCVQGNIRGEDVTTLNQHGRFLEMKPNSDEAVKTLQISFAKMNPGEPKMSAVFKRPFVCEVAGSGFDKAPNCEIFMLRFPRVLKVHWDRNWRHSICLDDLQRMATLARTVPLRQSLEQELLEWMAKLDLVDRGMNAKPASLEGTDDEKEPQGSVENAASAPVVASISADGALMHLSPSIWMDSSETASNHRRYGEGGTIKDLASKISTTCIGSESDSPCIGIASLSTTKQKRTVQEPDVPVLERPVKKARLSNSANTRSESIWSNKIAANHWQPLQEMTNSTQPALRQPFKNTNQSQQASLGPFDQTCKITMRAKDFAAQTRTLHSSSLAKKTIKSACSTTDLTRVTVSCRPQHTRPHPRSEDHPTWPALSITDDETFIPDMSKCRVILSSCLLSRMPDNASRLLQELPMQIVPLRPDRTTSILDPYNAERPGLLYLVDANDAPKATASAIHTLASCLTVEYRLPVQVWDWRIVLLRRHLDSSNTTRRQRLAVKLWIANLSLVPACGEEQSYLLVQWADGESTKESSDTFERLWRRSNMWE